MLIFRSEAGVVGRQSPRPFEAVRCAGPAVAPLPYLSGFAGPEPADSGPRSPGLPPGIRRKSLSPSSLMCGPFDESPGENTASPDIRQSERLAQRVTVGSGTRSRHPRTARSIPGIDRCFRKGFLDIFPPGFCLFANRMADPATKVYEKESATVAQSTDNERKEILAGIAVETI